MKFILDALKRILGIRSPSKMIYAEVSPIDLYNSDMVNEIITVISKHTPFPYSEIKKAHVQTRSFDLVLYAIMTASVTGMGVPLHELVRMTTTKEGYLDYMQHRFKMDET